MSPVRSNGEKGGSGAHQVSAPDHLEAVASEPGQDMGDSVSGGSVVSRGYSINGHLHWLYTGDSGSVGGFVLYLWSM